MPRIVPGAEAAILRTLEGFGFEWDGAVIRQSTRTEAYEAAVESLRTGGHVYECSCSRRVLAEEPGDPGASAYPGTCRAGPSRPGPTSLRFRMPEAPLPASHDRFQGPIDFDARIHGDFVLRRRDGLFTYQLAVVVDDAWQGVTDIVRGADLLGSTPWQAELAHCLDYRRFSYAHLPLVTEPDGGKLAKSKRSLPLGLEQASAQLIQALGLLNQRAPDAAARLTPGEILRYAIECWDPLSIRGFRQARAPE